jgi:ABC-type multidrug transport system ATPase subunit
MGASGCGKTTLLSSILGMVALDEGEIAVLGFKTKSNEVQRAGSRIGYMPQETALIGELTIKETIYYFGKIFQMDIDKIRERYEMLHKLLELPDGDKRVEECSGGQMRRVSFAAAMVHEPDLLILDEPTVGLDPILREKIWTFLLNITRNSKLAVIITTHYIEEARQADRVGLMRNGVLLAEDPPMLIINKLGVENLEEAFYQMCLRRGVSEEVSTDVQANNNNSINEFELKEGVRAVESNMEVKDETETFFDKRKWRWFIVKALLIKNLLQLKRQPA